MGEYRRIRNSYGGTEGSNKNTPSPYLIRLSLGVIRAPKVSVSESTARQLYHLICSSPTMSARQKTLSYVCRSCLDKFRPMHGGQPRVPTGRAAASTMTTTQRTSVAVLPSKEPYLRRTANTPSWRSLAVLRRCYSNTTTADLPGQPAETGFALLVHRSLISLTGADAAKFLQGLVTNNVDPENKDPFYSAFLDARGRVLWDVFIWPLQDENGQWGCYIEVEDSEHESLARHLKRHKLRSKITIQLLKDNDAPEVWAAWGAQSAAVSSKSLIGVLEDPRALGFGKRLLVRGGELPSEDDFKPLPLPAYQLRRYMYGIPEGPLEIPRESALPMEANIDLANGIDFKKGCYVGQELTIRTKHTGVVRKRILPVQVYNAGEPIPADNGIPRFDPDWKWEGSFESGMDIKQLDEEGSIKKGRAAGKFVAAVGNVGLALCRLEMMTPMRISAEGGSYKPGLEFGMQMADGEKTVRVKAFLPTWFVESEKKLWDKGRQKMGIN